MGKGFTEMTVAELRAFLAEPDVARHAASMGITHNTKTRKDELIEIARRVHADMITDRSAKDALHAELKQAREDFPNGGEVTLSPDASRGLTNLQIMSGLDTIARLIGYKRIDRARKVERSRTYGVNGRGMGAKHFPMRSNGYGSNVDLTYTRIVG